MPTTEAAIRERPILYSGAMVRAIRKGIKTQTRRVMKPQPPAWIDSMGYTAFTPKGSISGRGEWQGEPAEKFFRCSHGQRSERLWVREMWASHFMWTGFAPSKICPPPGTCVYYRADGEDPDAGMGGCKSGSRQKDWRPSIHMPRWASRITLEITDVRVERAQSISDADIVAEGVAECGETLGLRYSPRALWIHLWDSINGKRDGGKWAWDNDPWTWAITFRPVEITP